MAAQSSDSPPKVEEVNTTTNNKMVDDSTSSSSSSSSEEKGVESKSGSDPQSSSVITIKNKQKEEVSNNNTTTNKVDSSSSSSEEDESAEEKGVEEEVSNNTTTTNKVDSSSSSSEEDESEEEKGVEEEVSNNNTTTNKVDSSSSSEEDKSEEEKGVEEEDGSEDEEEEEEDESHIANQKVQEKQKSEEEIDNDEEAVEDEESRRRSNQEIRMKKKNDVMVLVAASTEDDEKVSEPEEDPNAVVVFNPNTDEIAKTQSTSKRPLEEDISSADQGTKKKKVGVAGESTKSKSKFDKIFTDDDELVIMKGLVDLNSKHKRFPRYTQLTNWVKPSISFPVTSRQISEKVRRVNKKYLNKNANANKGGKDMKYTPHDLEVFELCEKIWGDQNQSTYNKKRGIKKQEVGIEENSKFITFVNDYLGKIMAIGGGGIRHIDLGVFDEGKRAYFAKKLKALMVKELELYSEKAELVTAVVEELKSKQREAAI